ncbi:FtsX-like permease family protein [Microbacterium pumilum]|uniref:FtsX-like permease family protein n=1 Tax=Microbacterium pumilum TaxID=344165 RepID=A0ABP5E7G0_9MICO
MKRSPGLFALTRRRFATPRSAALVIVALTAFAAFVIAAAPRALVGVVHEEVAHQISSVPATSRDLESGVQGVPRFGPAIDPAVTEDWDADAAAVFGRIGQSLADNRDAFEPVLLPIIAPAEFAAYAEPIDATPETLAPSAPIAQVQLLSEPAMQQHLQLVDGEWPAAWRGEGPVGIVLTEDAAATMKWPLGEVRTYETRDASGATSPQVELVALVEAVDPDADRWLHLPTALSATVFDDGNRRPVATSVAWVNPGSWEQIAISTPRPRVSAWYPIDGAAAVGADPRAMLAAIRAATSASVPFDDSGQFRAQFSTEIVGVLASALARADSASAILAVAATGPLAVSVALVVLAAALVIRRRRADLALMSARGAPISRLRALLFGEGILLGVPVAAIAAAMGVAVTVHDAGMMPTILAVLVGVAPALALVLTLRPAVLEHGRADLDTPSRSRVGRIAEAVLVVLAIIAVGLLLVRGIGPATAGIDPLVVAAPLLATVALALIFVRLYPVPIAAALRAARSGRGVVALVGSARSLRDPAAGTTAVLAMLVAVAIAVFSSVVLATVDRGAVVAAQRDVGADVQLSGPIFDSDTIDEMRAVDGVADAVGVLRGDYLAVSGPDGRATAQAVVSDIERLAAVQRGMVGAVPSGAVRPGADPIQIIESTEIARQVGTGDATAGDKPVEIAGTVDRMLGLSVGPEFLIVDEADYEPLSGLGFYPRTVVVDVAEDADPSTVAALLGDLMDSTYTVRILEESTAEIRDSPAVSALRLVLVAALAVAVALSVIALLLVAGVSRDARSRVIALLRTLGLDRRGGRAIVAWEFVPLGITALIGGVVLGAVLPLLVVTSIDLRPFTGGAAQPRLAIDPVLSGLLIAAVVVALGLAVVAGVVSARTTSMATVLRTEED